jgi:hypothetical protein
MAEANNGKGKITIEVEVNEDLMDFTKECMTAIPEMIPQFRKEKKIKDLKC